MKALISIVAVGALLTIAGCGGDDGSSPTSAPSTTAAETNATETTAAGANGAKANANGNKESGSQRNVPDDFPIEPAGKLQGPEIKVEAPKGPPPKKLVIRDIEVGSGEEAGDGKKVTIQFTGIYYDGELFESSWQFGNPFRFELGNDKVSPGWEEGIPGMKVGGQRELIVPYTLTSQFSPLPGKGPEDAQVWIVDLLDVS